MLAALSFLLPFCGLRSQQLADLAGSSLGLLPRSSPRRQRDLARVRKQVLNLNLNFNFNLNFNLNFNFNFSHNKCNG